MQKNYGLLKEQDMKVKNKYIFGIQIGHDSSCCVIKNNNIIYAEEEERKNGIKNFTGIPWESIEYAIKNHEIIFDEINCIAIPWDYDSYIESRLRIIEDAKFEGNIIYSARKQNILNNFKQNINELQRRFPNSKIKFVQHHLSHIFSTIPFYPNISLKRTSAIIADALGELNSCSFYSNLKELEIINIQSLNESIGYFYQRFAELVGFKGRQAPGYFMSLASLGDSHKFKASLEKYFLKREDGIYKLNSKNFKPLKGFNENAHLCFPNEFLIDINFDANNKNEVVEYKDICASVQCFVEEIVLSWCRFIKETSNTENLLLSGGVFLNCKLNQRIKDLKLFKNVYLGSASKDSGTSLGAAVYVRFNQTNNRNILNQNLSAYLGTEITGREKVFESLPQRYSYYTEHLAKEIVKDLINNKVIAIAIDKLEFGPRALGARSIICLPNNKELSKKINKIKKRFSFQPFAGTISEESALVFFDCTANEEFMTTTYYANKNHQIEGILHEDLTCRIHVVNSNKSPKLINEIFDELRKINLPQIILNTSFNGKEKPLPSSARDALLYYLELDIDVLYTPVSRIEICKSEKDILLKSLKETTKRQQCI
jgi:carbamoyltransferase